MSKGLIVAPLFFDYSESIKRSFEVLGWNASLVLYDTPVHPHNVWMKWRCKFSFNRTALGNAGYFQYAARLAMEWENDRIVYFLEDDYLHRDNTSTVLSIIVTVL